MYLNFYQLQVEPFDITPDPEFLLLNDSYKEALGAITYGIKHRKGFISVVGEVGTGKTTLVHAYLNRRDRETLIAIYIFDPSLSFDELVEECALGLGVDVSSATPGRKIQRLHWALLNAFKAGKNVALIIDEAQNLPVATLEKLRMLSNFETDKNKLLQLVLVGQPELRTKLNRHELRQLKQRVALTAEIGPLTFRESLRYIDHRIRIASYSRKPLFTRGAKRLIAKKAQGIPRNINVLADNALIAGYAMSERPVRRSTVKSVLHDRSRAQDEPWGAVPKVRRAVLAAMFVAALGAIGSIYGTTSERQPADAVETPGPAEILPGPMAAHETQLFSEDSAEPATSEEPELPPMAAHTHAQPEAVVPEEGLEVAPAPATATPPNRPPAEPVREPDLELEAIEPQPLARASTTGREDPGPAQPESDDPEPLDYPEERVEPDPVRLSAEEQMVVLHPVIPPFRLSLGSSPEATEQPEEPWPGPAAGAPSADAAEQRESPEASRRSLADERPAYNRIWRVRRGEFLWDIALRHYGYVDRDLVAHIRRANPDIPNINLIHPGDRLVLPPVDHEGGAVARPQ